MKIELTYTDNVAQMKVEGIITSENSYLFQEKLNEVFKKDVTMLELDLLECKNLSSSALGKLLMFYKDFIAKGGEIEVIRCSNNVFDLFTMLKLNHLFTVNLG